MEFDKKSLLELRKLNLEDLKQYYLKLREYQYENNVPLKGLEIRRNIHSILVSLIKIDRLLSKENLIVLSNEQVRTDKPVIYACTHIGGNDIQRTFEAIREHAYLFLGDPEGIYQDFSGVMLYFNGVICLETSNKKDRHIAKQRAIELLKKGGNLLIYPEGAWNITDNLPVMKLYTGTVKMALETGADIVPIAIEQYDNIFYVNIGKNIDMDSCSNLDIISINTKLRDEMSTLKWQIWEYQGIQERKDISNEFIKSFKQNIVDRCEYGFTVDDVYSTMYKDPNEVSPDEVFKFVKKIGS